MHLAVEALEDRCTPNLLGPAPPGSDALLPAPFHATGDTETFTSPFAPAAIRTASHRLQSPDSKPLTRDMASQPLTQTDSLRSLTRPGQMLAFGPLGTADGDLLGVTQVITPPGVATASEFYVSPEGTPGGDGSLEDPWDLATALAQPATVRPGATIWLRGGTYSGTFTSRLTGADGTPIVVRQYPGERATVDGGSSRNSPLTVNGAWSWYWGFEVMNSDPDRWVPTPGSDPPELQRSTGVNVFGPHTKFINLLVHDTAQGFGFWTPAEDAELYGNLIYHNGWEAPDRGHGHGIYAQNRFGTKVLADNILFNQFSYGVHAYGSSAAYLDHFYLEGNISFQNGVLSQRSGLTTNILVGGGRIAEGPTLVSNYTYFPTPPTGGGANNLGYSAGCRDAGLWDNYFAGGLALTLVNCQNVALAGNTFYGRLGGFTPAQFPDNTYHSQRPAENLVVVRPNAYEAGRAHFAIYNWELGDEVAVDVSGLGLALGDLYEIRNVQNYDGDIITGVYDGNPVVVPMTDLTVTKPVGWPAPPSTLPEFGAFVFTAFPPEG